MKAMLALLMLLPLAAHAQTAANPLPPSFNTVSAAPAGSAGAASDPVTAAVSDAQSFGSWFTSQKAYLGVGYILKGDKAKWEVSYWDLLQFGQSGINVAKPTANDYVDIGLAQAMANQRQPRWGVAIPIHAGNIWNDVHFTAKVDSHVGKAKLPPIVVSYVLLLPHDQNTGTDLPITKLRPWDRDGMVTICWGFGGPSQPAQ